MALSIIATHLSRRTLMDRKRKAWLSPTAWPCFLLLLPALIAATSCRADRLPAPASKVLLDMGPGVEGRVTPSSGQVSVARSADPAAPGLNVTIQPGAESYPGLGIKATGGAWNLSAYGHVEARVVNTGSSPLSLSLRVDNAGNWQDNPWDTESLTLAPGQAGTLKTVFGYAYGLKPGYHLNPSAVVNILLFTGKAPGPQSFRLESLAAAGAAGETPPVAPDDVRVAPAHGMMLGTGAASHPAAQAVNGAQAAWIDSGRALAVAFPPAQSEQSVSLQPSQGRWDLRDFLQVQIRVRNTGQSPVLPRARLESNGGPTDWVTAPAALAPGGEGIITVPFAPDTPVDLTTKQTGGRITSDAVSAVTLAVDGAAAERDLRVVSVQALLPPADLPDWLGKRPPAPGDWVKTLDDEFNGPALDTRLWSIYGDNYWDKESH